MFPTCPTSTSSSNKILSSKVEIRSDDKVGVFAVQDLDCAEVVMIETASVMAPFCREEGKTVTHCSHCMVSLFEFALQNQH